MSVSSLSIATSSLPLSSKIPSIENFFSLNSNSIIPFQFKSSPKPTFLSSLKFKRSNHYPSFTPLFSLSTFQLTQDENEVGRLYVGNLPYAMTSSQLADFFAEAGRVVTVEIVYDRVTDRSRGFGFVTMGSVEEAKEAIKLFDGSQVGGRTVRVNFPEVPKGGEREIMRPKIRSSYQGFVDTPHKLYASNLSWNLTSEALREAFEGQPGLLSTKVIYDQDSGRSRGFGFITFSSAEEAESALDAMNGVELLQRPLLLKFAEQRGSPSPLPTTPEREYDNAIDNS
ncbi:hypothetical protein LguiB_033355 [Lonicera macranthoides]